MTRAKNDSRRQEKATGITSVLRTVSGKEVSSTQDEEEIEIHQFITEPAKVTLTMGVTLNLGNYEGARIDVGITVPCYKEEVDQAHADALKWVETRIVKEIDQLRDHTRKRVETNPYD